MLNLMYKSLDIMYNQKEKLQKKTERKGGKAN